jgi:hypothetical protein
MKRCIRRTAAALSLSIFALAAFMLPIQSQTPPWWYYGCPQGLIPQVPGNVPGRRTTGWTQYQSCLQQNLSVSTQQSAKIAPILANEGRKVIAIRNNNLLSNVQKTQEVKAVQKQSDPQLKTILSPAQYEKLQVGRRQAMRWTTQARLGWQ